MGRARSTDFKNFSCSDAYSGRDTCYLVAMCLVAILLALLESAYSVSEKLEINTFISMIADKTSMAFVIHSSITNINDR